MKKISYLALAVILIIGLAACSKKEAAKPAIGRLDGDVTVLKIGVNGTDFRLWDSLNARLAAKKIRLEPISFSDYVKPNIALAEKEIDLNAFQHALYFNKFIATHQLNLSSIGYTFIAPLGLYSQKITSLADLKDGAKIAIPNDATNGGRALLLLESAGLIKLDGTDKVTPNTKNIAENPKHLEFLSIESVQIPRSLSDVDLGAINGGAATDAGLFNYIFREDPNQPNAEQYFNIIAVRTEDKDLEIFKSIMDVYHTAETAAAIKEIYKGAYIPVF